MITAHLGFYGQYGVCCGRCGPWPKWSVANTAEVKVKVNVDLYSTSL